MLASRAELLRKFFDQLNEDEATALLLRIMMGHSMEEISEITAVSVNTVKTRLRLGKTRVWAAINGHVAVTAAAAAGLPIHGIVLRTRGIDAASLTGRVVSANLGVLLTF